MDRCFARYRVWGLLAGLFVALAIIGAGTFLAYEGRSALALVLILGDLAAVVAVFVYAHLAANDED